MFRLAVASDSHGDLYALNAFSRIAQQEADAVCHLGDCVSDAEELRRKLDKPLYCVRGNCDLFRGAPDMRLETFGGVRALLCHGHIYDVKTSATRLVRAARENEATLALFGHTHRALERVESGVFLINPGALRDGRFAFVDIENGTPYATFEMI